MSEFDCVVIGAGVVGLAIARRLAQGGLQTIILEKNENFGAETSSRNSEVIHAGIYYPQGSLKARLCVHGRELLYRYCQERGLPHRRCGKMIVATDESQLLELETIAANASRNGVTDLSLVDGREACVMEPSLQCCGALISPSTGIVDSHALMLALLGEAEQAGAILACRSEVTRIVPVASRRELEVSVGDDPVAAIRCHWVVNSAGLGAAQLASRIEQFPREHIPTIRFAKGNYFAFAGRAPFSRLVYPLPKSGGLGVHMTLDLAGRARFGPDVEWVDTIDYKVDPTRASGFEREVRSYWPSIPDGSLKPDYAGIRPKLSGPGEPAQDFAIEGPVEHTVQGIVNLFGIESPGLTACLSISDHVAEAIVSRKS